MRSLENRRTNVPTRHRVVPRWFLAALSPGIRFAIRATVLAAERCCSHQPCQARLLHGPASAINSRNIRRVAHPLTLIRYRLLERLVDIMIEFEVFLKQRVHDAGALEQASQCGNL
jgi:hypothetical protein